MIMQMQINAAPSLLRYPRLPKDFRHLMQFLSNAHIDAEMSVKLTSRHIYNASAPSATRPSKPAKVEVRAAPPSDSWTSCASPVGAAVEPRVEEEVVMLAVLLPEAWWEAEEAMAAAVATTLSVTGTPRVEGMDVAASRLAKSVTSTATTPCAATRGSTTRFSVKPPTAPPTTPTPAMRTGIWTQE